MKREQSWRSSPEPLSPLPLEGRDWDSYSSTALWSPKGLAQGQAWASRPVWAGSSSCVGPSPPLAQDQPLLPQQLHSLCLLVYSAIMGHTLSSSLSPVNQPTSLDPNPLQLLLALLPFSAQARKVQPTPAVHASSPPPLLSPSTQLPWPSVLAKVTRC